MTVPAAAQPSNRPVSLSRCRGRARTSLAAGLAAAALLSGAGVAVTAPAANAEPSNYRFDFGNGPVEHGYT